ncbi:CHAT domain-containing protein [Taklimakanibacter lacteus]|uniref:CHAT domain-containing protein n=1 Tax=Taklimakanibacter lacteus TaxID=2268456 RepID=UPI0013C4C0C7
MIAIALIEPAPAEETPAILLKPEGSVLVRSDPAVKALLDAALEAAAEGDNAAIGKAIGEAAALIDKQKGASGRHMTALHQEAASDYAIAGNSEAALAHGRRAIALGRNLAASYLFYRDTAIAMPVFEQTEPFRDFLSTASTLMEGADAALSRQVTDEAFRAAQLAHMTRAGFAVLRHQARRAASEGRQSDEVKFVHMMADALGPYAQTEREIAAGLHGEPGSPYRLQKEALQANQGKLLRDAVALIAKEKIDIAGILLPRPLGVDEVARLLAPDEALVLFVEGNMAEVHAFVVTHDAVRWSEVPVRILDIDALAARFRGAIGAPLGRSASVLATADQLADDSNALMPAWQLYRDLLGPFSRELAGKSHLMVVADGTLAKLPFEALLTQAPPQGAADFRKLPWLVREHAVTVLPLLSTLTAREQPAPAGADATQGFLGIGNPDYALMAGKPGVIRAVEAMARLKPLPESEGEIRRIAAGLGATAQDMLFGQNASEKNLLALSESGALARYSVLMFATHGLLPGEIDGLFEAALALTPSEKESRQSLVPSATGLMVVADGLLTTSEIPQLRLKASIVVLSACNTGADSPIDSEAYSGLASAFLSAGARSVLVSHWPVNSDAAVAITTATMRHWTSRRPGRDFALAFRQALLDVMQTSPEAARPSYWAPFSLLGEP